MCGLFEQTHNKMVGFDYHRPCRLLSFYFTADNDHSHLSKLTVIYRFIIVNPITSAQQNNLNREILKQTDPLVTKCVEESDVK